MAETREEFVARLLRLLNDRPQANILVAVESEIGVEMIHSVPSGVWAVGMIQSLDKLTDERFRNVVALQVEQAMKHEAEIHAKYAFNPDMKAN